MTIDYRSYKHSYAFALAPKLKTIYYNAKILKKPANYIKAIIKNTLNNSDVIWTDKEKTFFNNIMSITSSEEISKYCCNAVRKAGTVLVEVDSQGELIR